LVFCYIINYLIINSNLIIVSILAFVFLSFVYIFWCVYIQLISKIKNRYNNAEQQLSLVDINEGQKGVIVSVLGGRMAAKRLADLGLTPNTEIKLIRKMLYRGPIEIEVRGSNLVLGRGLASKILVKQKNNKV